MQVVMGHELTHVETRTWTTSSTPMWLSEGAADYSGYWDSGLAARSVLQELRQDLAGGDKPEALPTNTGFAASGAALSTAYQKSWLACRLIAETYGQAKLVAFYHAVGTGGSTGETLSEDPVDQAFRSVLGTTTAAFTTKWRQYVVSTARG